MLTLYDKPNNNQAYYGDEEHRVNKIIWAQRKLIRNVLVINAVLLAIICIPFFQTWFGFLMIFMLAFGANIELITLGGGVHNGGAWSTFWIYWVREYHLIDLGSKNEETKEYVRSLKRAGFVTGYGVAVLRYAPDAVQVKLMKDENV